MVEYNPNHFEEDEINNLDPDLVVRLDLAREYAGVPFIITSGYRTPEQNEAAGGKSNSAHLRGKAVDISAPTSYRRFHIVHGLFRAGVPRIVVYSDKNIVHADIDTSLPWPLLAVY